MTGTYRWHGGEEQMLRFAPDAPVRLTIFQPLFEEANRCRHLIVSLMRRLANEGIGSALPDLPGTGESLTPLSDVTFSDWREAAAAAVTGSKGIVAFRGAALVVPAAGIPVWQLSPETGARIVRDLERTGKSTDGQGVMLAGHRFDAAMLADIGAATLAEGEQTRTVRLATEAAPADAKIPGAPLWRRAEPGDDAVLETAIAADIAEWVRTCVAH